MLKKKSGGNQPEDDQLISEPKLAAGEEKLFSLGLD